MGGTRRRDSILMVSDGLLRPGGDFRIYIGTSGYNYPERRGSGYPEGFSTTKMLSYYSERFGTVEINYSFYRLPSEKALDG
jgi:uncharacterized protein YecE (DUF72 family)